jgi:hypothetical protein
MCVSYPRECYNIYGPIILSHRQGKWDEMEGREKEWEGGMDGRRRERGVD